MPVTKGQGNPDWTREETILALDLALRSYPKIPGKTSLEVRQLSEFIRQLPIHSEASRNERFRNPAGVYMKLINLVSLHPEKADRKGLRTSTTDRAVWKEYWRRPKLVAQLAREIAKGVRVLGEPDAQEIDLDGETEMAEGATLTRVHKLRERKRGFRRRVIRRVKKERGGLQCNRTRSYGRGRG